MAYKKYGTIADKNGDQIIVESKDTTATKYVQKSGFLPDGTNLNAIYKGGIYKLNSAWTYLNSPQLGRYASLFVEEIDEGDNYRVIQTITYQIDNGQVSYKRTGTWGNADWKNWQQLLTSTDIPDAGIAEFGKFVGKYDFSLSGQTYVFSVAFLWDEGPTGRATSLRLVFENTEETLNGSMYGSVYINANLSSMTGANYGFIVTSDFEYSHYNQMRYLFDTTNKTVILMIGENNSALANLSIKVYEKSLGAESSFASLTGVTGSTGGLWSQGTKIKMISNKKQRYYSTLVGSIEDREDVYNLIGKYDGGTNVYPLYQVQPLPTLNASTYMVFDLYLQRGGVSSSNISTKMQCVASTAYNAIKLRNDGYRDVNCNVVYYKRLSDNTYWVGIKVQTSFCSIMLKNIMCSTHVPPINLQESQVLGSTEVEILAEAVNEADKSFVPYYPSMTLVSQNPQNTYFTTANGFILYRCSGYRMDANTSFTVQVDGIGGVIYDTIESGMHGRTFTHLLPVRANCEIITNFNANYNADFNMYFVPIMKF
jgi:hypothetical protein